MRNNYSLHYPSSPGGEISKRLGEIFHRRERKRGQEGGREEWVFLVPLLNLSLRPRRPSEVQVKHISLQGKRLCFRPLLFRVAAANWLLCSIIYACHECFTGRATPECCRLWYLKWPRTICQGLRPSKPATWREDFLSNRNCSHSLVGQIDKSRAHIS